MDRVKSMRILHCIDSAGIYGAEVMLLNLMDEQRKSGITPVLLSMESLQPDSTSAIADEASRRGIDVVKAGFHRGYNRRDAYNIIDTARKNDIYIIHSHSYKSNILLGSLSHKTRTLPVLCTAHGWTSVSIFSKIGIYNLIDKLAIRRLDAVVYVNPVLRNVVHHRKYYHVCNGIASHEFQSPTNIDHFIKPSNKHDIIIGTTLRLSEEKGLIYLLESIRYLINQGSGLKLVIIGDGPLRNHYSDYIYSYGLEKHIQLLGYQPDAFQYLPFFDLFVMPSLTEGLPITLLEAMQSGTPVIATSVGAIPYVLEYGKYGTIVEPGNSTELANAINNFIKNKTEYSVSAELAKLHVLKEYSSHTMALKYLDIYREVINEHK